MPPITICVTSLLCANVVAILFMVTAVLVPVSLKYVNFISSLEKKVKLVTEYLQQAFLFGVLSQV